MRRIKTITKVPAQAQCRLCLAFKDIDQCRDQKGKCEPLVIVEL